jgi:hypothetical protein
MKHVCVKIGNIMSEWEDIYKGSILDIYKGSILDPVLFNKFINDIFYFALYLCP